MLLALCFAVLSSLACSPGETHRPEPVAQRESWYHHFHALPWSHELVGHNRDTTELYMRHFYDHWVGNKDSVRQKEFEAIVDTFARPDAIKASLGWYRATCEEETSPSAHAPEDPISIPTVVRWRDLDPVKPASWAEGREETVSVIRTAVSMAR